MMALKPKFWRWTLLFGAFGLLVPAVLLFRWFLFDSGFGEFAVTLWPSSIMFMALDSPRPSPISTIVFIYTLAFVENCLLYAAIGVITWPLAHLALRLYGFFRGISKSQDSLS
jgi:hypothetical protein